jgi:hypothetical protein
VHGHWTRGSYGDGNGGHCLVGALLHLSRKHRLPLVINMINSSSGGVEKALHHACPNQRFHRVEAEKVHRDADQVKPMMVGPPPLRSRGCPSARGRPTPSWQGKSKRKLLPAGRTHPA